MIQQVIGQLEQKNEALSQREERKEGKKVREESWYLNPTSTSHLDWAEGSLASLVRPQASVKCMGGVP